ncbi:hypothetical protein [Anaerococcus sp. mt242]|uniref:hypothetical protein n=1 Tax=unclassified Anaerococcus TaxID=2614126 RepID=UPI001932FE18|nr:hypothetical protein [Anaerococcus sp. mt242]MBM0046638.1 hypothetical protein [Anaerococcus sp. mt242]
MSNYSFNIIDENNTDVLEYIFEIEKYPIDEEKFSNNVKKYIGDESKEFIQKLLELEVIRRVNNDSVLNKVMVISTIDDKKLIETKLNQMDFIMDAFFEIENVSEDNSELEKYIKNSEMILVFSNSFRPDIFYTINSYIVEENKDAIFSYMDGDEGIVLPLLEPKYKGCYNDFELLRESSFHNLLEYQIMKEEIIKKRTMKKSSFYSAMLLDWSIVIMNFIKKQTQINTFAQSIDFERMHFSKTKLFRFPKCPSCQGDSNLTHPFI